MYRSESEWVVIGTYEDEGRWISEVMAEGFRSEEEARQERGRMARRCPEVAFDVQSRHNYDHWVK